MRISIEEVRFPQLLAFGDMLSLSEMGTQILKESDDGYDVLVGSRPGDIHRIPDYSRHPHILVAVNYHNNKTGAVEQVKSSAAGRYQYIFPTWQEDAAAAGVADFSPVSQDRVLIATLKRIGVYALICNNDISGAIEHAHETWASLPGSTSGQPQNKLRDLIAAYNEAILHYNAGNAKTPDFSNVISGVVSTAQGVVA